MIALYRDLLRRGLLIVASSGTAKEQLGLFFVRKPGKDLLRVIVDARRANVLFSDPAGVSLCSALLVRVLFGVQLATGGA